MTVEEELLYYYKRATMFLDKFAQEKGEPENREEKKEDFEFIELIKNVIESRKKGENKYDHFDRHPDDLKTLALMIKEIADGLENLGEGLN